MNDLSLVSNPYVTGDKLEIEGSIPDGSLVAKFEVSVNHLTTVGSLLGGITSKYAGVSASIDATGRIVFTGNGGNVNGLEVTITDKAGNEWQGNFPGINGAKVTFNGITIQGGEVQAVGGLLSQNQAQTTLNESRFVNNHGLAFDYQTYQDDLGGVVKLVNTPIIVSGGTDTADSDGVFASNKDGFLNGIVDTFGGLSERIDDAFTDLSIPLIGDQLIDGLLPIFDGFDTLSELGSLLADVTSAATESGVSVT